MEIIDITYTLSSDFVFWPGSIGFTSNWQMRMPGETNNLSTFKMDSHGGTHLDAPLHFIQDGKSIHEISIQKCIGTAYVAEIRGKRDITFHDLEESNIPMDCKRLLLKTDNQIYWESKINSFQEDFCSIDKSGAEWIVQRGIELVGIDYLSIQRFKHGPETHQILLEAEIIIVETLNLENVQQGWYELICLPLKIEGLEGCPVRAILRKN